MSVEERLKCDASPERGWEAASPAGWDHIVGPPRITADRTPPTKEGGRLPSRRNSGSDRQFCGAGEGT